MRNIPESLKQTGKGMRQSLYIRQRSFISKPENCDHELDFAEKILAFCFVVRITLDFKGDTQGHWMELAKRLVVAPLAPTAHLTQPHTMSDKFLGIRQPKSPIPFPLLLPNQ